MPEPSEPVATDSLSIASLVPNLFQKLRPTFEGNSPLIMAGSILIMNDAYILPTVSGLLPGLSDDSRGMLYGAFGGYAFLNKLSKTAPKDYQKLLWSPSRGCMILIGSCQFDDSLDSLLQVFEATKFGIARVDADGMFRLITLDDIVELVRRGWLHPKLSVEAVGSPVLTISQDASIKEAIGSMLAHRVRRLFVHRREPAFVSDRSIISFLFSGARLSLARENPEKWIDARVSDIRLQEAPVVGPRVALGKAANLLGAQSDACVLTEDGRVVSRWDIIMKPWKAGLLMPGAADAIGETAKEELEERPALRPKQGLA
jgi:CBS domain-containing protein